ncbi:MAG: PTS sugar transporter subunit IIA [Gammaproteobacteria bacterium]
MKVGLLIITHDHIGSSLLDTAINMMGVCPLAVDCISVTSGCDPDGLNELARKKVSMVNQGAGVIVLTDMYGSTPSNIATNIESAYEDVVVITGLNLPMLVRLLNYPHLTLDQLTGKAISGGRDSIFLCKSDVAEA